MRTAFGLFTAFPIDADAEDMGIGWVATTAVGLVLGLAWLAFHQTLVRVGGPFSAAGGVLLIHVALTGARPLRGLAAVTSAVTQHPDADAAPRGLPDANGAASAVIALLLVIATSFLIRVDIAPAALVLMPLIAKSTQALLLGSGDHDVGVDPPTAAQKVLIVLTTVAAMAATPVLAGLVRPARLDPPVQGLQEYMVLGLIGFVATMAIGLLSRAWLRARFGALDANGWHAIGAVTELSAVAVVASRIS